MPDGFLRQRLIGVAVAENSLEPAQSLAEIAAKTRRQREIMRNQANVMLVRLFFRQFERVAKLLFGLRPRALRNPAKPARIGALQKSFGVFVNQGFGFFQIIKRRRVVAFAARQTRQRMQRFGFAGFVRGGGKQFDGAIQKFGSFFGFAAQPCDFGIVEKRARKFFQRFERNLLDKVFERKARADRNPLAAFFGDDFRRFVKIFGFEQERQSLFPLIFPKVKFRQTVFLFFELGTPDFRPQAALEKIPEQRVQPVNLARFLIARDRQKDVFLDQLGQHRRTAHIGKKLAADVQRQRFEQ